MTDEGIIKVITILSAVVGSGGDRFLFFHKLGHIGYFHVTELWQTNRQHFIPPLHISRKAMSENIII